MSVLHEEKCQVSLSKKLFSIFFTAKTEEIMWFTRFFKLRFCNVKTCVILSKFSCFVYKIDSFLKISNSTGSFSVSMKQVESSAFRQKTFKKTKEMLSLVVFFTEN